MCKFWQRDSEIYEYKSLKGLKSTVFKLWFGIATQTICLGLIGLLRIVVSNLRLHSLLQMWSPYEMTWEPWSDSVCWCISSWSQGATCWNAWLIYTSGQWHLWSTIPLLNQNKPESSLTNYLNMDSSEEDFFKNCVKFNLDDILDNKMQHWWQWRATVSSQGGSWRFWVVDIILSYIKLYEVLFRTKKLHQCLKT